MITGLWVLPLPSSTSTSIDEGTKERVFGKLTILGFWIPLSFSPPSVTTAIFGSSLPRGTGLLKKGTLSSNFGKIENRFLGFWELSFWVTILLFSVSAIVFWEDLGRGRIVQGFWGFVVERRKQSRARDEWRERGNILINGKNKYMIITLTYALDVPLLFFFFHNSYILWNIMSASSVKSRQCCF